LIRLKKWKNNPNNFPHNSLIFKENSEKRSQLNKLCL